MGLQFQNQGYALGAGLSGELAMEFIRRFGLQWKASTEPCGTEDSPLHTGRFLE